MNWRQTLCYFIGVSPKISDRELDNIFRLIDDAVAEARRKMRREILEVLR